jgi:hypothetical protein
MFTSLVKAGSELSCGSIFRVSFMRRSYKTSYAVEMAAARFQRGPTDVE